MTIAVTVSSNTGTYQDGTYTIGPVVSSSTFASLQINSLTFPGAQFISTTGPAGANGFFVQPPSSNLVGITLKGITGDTGTPCVGNQPIGPLYFATPSNANTVGLTSAGAIAGVVTITFF